MTLLHFITHPEVAIDPAVPVPDWPLSAVGIRRMRLALGRPWVAGVRSVFSSAERKATEAAGLLAEKSGTGVRIIASLGENDRSATGYLPKAEFEAVADEFFARPKESIRGWERACDAQARIIDAIEHITSSAPKGDVAIVSHGGVGALLLCYLKGLPIRRSEDQPGEGGGNFYSIRVSDRFLVSGWRRIED